eukprot:jgi/Botrbrau1/13250/Bobra.0199s0017.1
MTSTEPCVRRPVRPFRRMVGEGEVCTAKGIDDCNYTTIAITTMIADGMLMVFFFFFSQELLSTEAIVPVIAVGAWI